MCSALARRSLPGKKVRAEVLIVDDDLPRLMAVGRRTLAVCRDVENDYVGSPLGINLVVKCLFVQTDPADATTRQALQGVEERVSDTESVWRAIPPDYADLIPSETAGIFENRNFVCVTDPFEYVKSAYSDSAETPLFVMSDLIMPAGMDDTPQKRRWHPPSLDTEIPGDLAGAYIVAAIWEARGEDLGVLDCAFYSKSPDRVGKQIGLILELEVKARAGHLGTASLVRRMRQILGSVATRCVGFAGYSTGDADTVREVRGYLADFAKKAVSSVAAASRVEYVLTTFWHPWQAQWFRERAFQGWPKDRGLQEQLINDAFWEGVGKGYSVIRTFREFDRMRGLPTWRRPKNSGTWERMVAHLEQTRDHAFPRGFADRQTFGSAGDEEDPPSDPEQVMIRQLRTRLLLCTLTALTEEVLSYPDSALVRWVVGYNVSHPETESPLPYRCPLCERLEASIRAQLTERDLMAPPFSKLFHSGTIQRFYERARFSQDECYTLVHLSEEDPDIVPHIKPSYEEEAGVALIAPHRYGMVRCQADTRWVDPVKKFYKRLNLTGPDLPTVASVWLPWEKETSRTIAKDLTAADTQDNELQ